MSAYALAHLRMPTINEDVLNYLESIEGTLHPFGGRFLIHGGDVDVLEGAWPGTVVVIEFPDYSAAKAWYASPAYQDILPLRTNHIAGDAIIIEGVPTDYDACRTVALLRQQLAGSIGRSI